MLKIKSRIKRAHLESKKIGNSRISSFLLSYVLSILIKRGYSKEIARNYKLLVKFKNPVIHFYLAKSLHLNGIYEKAIETININLVKNFSFLDSHYILSDCYHRVNYNTKSWGILESVLAHSNRLKTWLLLANQVNTKDDFSRLHRLWQLHVDKQTIPPYHFELNGYIATGALRAKEYELAESIWRDIIQSIIDRRCVYSSPKNKKLNINDAGEALLDLKRVLQTHSIEFFLVSGTLLGCIRENTLLGHDKDIDIGIWREISPKIIEKIIIQSGLFEMQAIRSEHVLRIKHVNQVAIDIFYHYKEESNYWHGGVKLKWNNTPFTLIDHEFLGDTFKIPEDHNLYLTENYGDWKTPKKDFDSAFDTPNAIILNQDEMNIHAYKQLAMAYLEGNQVNIKKFSDYLKTNLV